MEIDAKRRRELETKVLDKVGEVISAIKTATQVDQVVSALHSLAVLLFPLDSSLFIGSIDEHYRDELRNAKAPDFNERNEWWQVFYQGAAFPALARVLLLDVASNWLACFPFSVKKHLYDVFFLDGVTTEVVQTLVPCLQCKGNDSTDANAVCANTERLLVLCLVEHDGVLRIARELGGLQNEEFADAKFQPLVSRVAQIIASIPDKTRPRAPASLSSHLFFKHITSQLLLGGEESSDTLNKYDKDGTLLFIGETFSRICRRGSSDVLLSEVVPAVWRHIQRVLSSRTDPITDDMFKSDPRSWFWLTIMGAIKDHYAVERMSGHLLRQLSIEQPTDTEAYWILWILFNQIFQKQPSVRSMFVEKFLLWEVFPMCCLRWIIQFSVLECPPVANVLTRDHETHGLLETMQRLIAVWSKREFVQSASVEQQACILSIFYSNLCFIEFGRLESPTHLVRKMASSVALAFSRVIDPKNPLYLDDSCNEETIDWEFGFGKPERGTLSNPSSTERNVCETPMIRSSEQEKDLNITRMNGRGKKDKGASKTSSPFKLVDPDEIIDPATLNYDSSSDKDADDDAASQNSDDSSDSSLQPYDLTDDDTDLKRKLSQLVDVVGALRKSDDAEGVERALDVAEKLVRAAPDELTHLAGDLARTLTQVRCSDLAVDGEEESAEEKRQRALVALLVTCPFQSVETLTKLLYSPNVDVSQRIMILDVMTEAAQELATAKTSKPKIHSAPLISTISENQAWFLPSSKGTPGAGPWKEVSETGTPLNYSYRYERVLPPKPGQISKGKTRRWGLRSSNIQDNQLEWTQNKFPVYAAAFMLPVMEGFDRKRHGVDFLGRDFIVLGKLVYMLGVCMRCMSMHPEASALASPLLQMLRTREVCNHKEAFVRRAVLFAASSILVALHPSYVASALTEGNLEVSKGLEWIRTWALNVAESDVDRECYMLAMSCLQLHAEMAMQASRALESASSTVNAKHIGLPSNLTLETIKIPYSNVQL
ncbi:hypothetical protein Tsubulata_023429 [Turnera subulata]|uniref:Telomere length regulation protein conserved domain-containing protein n=1 Tax=Turnera subulata TaxID=218843 RepID=A0A9Q0F3T3_9ROSI|nr:hypothetical protein Tsubulata_023429 [Turnera subulata]